MPFEICIPDDFYKSESFISVFFKAYVFIPWIVAAEIDILSVTERNINFSKGLKKGSNEEKINVIKNLLSVNSPVETIAVAISLSVDEVKNIIKKHEINKNNV